MSDAGLKSLVEEELEFEPRVNAAHIGVAVRDGVVTLTGHVASYAEKVAAEKAAQRVRGVKAIAEEIEVRYPYDGKRSDDNIAARAINVLDWNTLVRSAVKVKVERGWVTLTGTVDWHFIAKEVARAAGQISGVTGVSNLIKVGDIPTPADVKARIMAAFKRQAGLDASGVSVTTEGSTVTLRGRVKAWGERRMAELAAWSAPGVTDVEDYLAVDS